jgi:hypothetical protein
MGAIVDGGKADPRALFLIKNRIWLQFVRSVLKRPAVIKPTDP